MFTSATTERTKQTARAVVEVYLSKPGGQREGPYGLEQIKQDLATRKYHDTDYWAWYEGLTEWVPLYSLPGIAVPPGRSPRWSPSLARNTAQTPLDPKLAAAVDPQALARQPANEMSEITIAAFPSDARPKPAEATLSISGLQEESTPVTARLASGMPASALEQVFMFTTGDGPALWQSSRVIRMMQDIVGEHMATIRGTVARDVVGGCEIGELLKPDGSISEGVWRSMASRRPALVQQARERLYRICVRTFRADTDAVVAVVLFYNKAML
jgi:hypothetical protein